MSWLCCINYLWKRALIATHSGIPIRNPKAILLPPFSNKTLLTSFFGPRLPSCCETKHSAFVASNRYIFLLTPIPTIVLYSTSCHWHGSIESRYLSGRIRKAGTVPSSASYSSKSLLSWAPACRAFRLSKVISFWTVAYKMADYGTSSLSRESPVC